MRSVLATWLSRGISMLAESIDTRIPTSEPNGKTLYLTFDDGPTESGTIMLLETLRKFDVPATFFLVGENAEQIPQFVTQICDAGHAVGNHSYSHIDAWKSSRRATLVDFLKGSRVLEQLTGGPLRLMRPPYGRVTKAVARWAKRKRQRLTLWDVMPPDFEPGITAERVARTFLQGVRNGSIICMHDNENSRSVTPAVLEDCLPRLIDDGWTFALLPSAAKNTTASQPGQ